MRRYSVLVWIAAFATVALAGCGGPAPLPEDRPSVERAMVEDWRIEPGARAGALTRFASELDLIKAYGGRNVRDSSIALGEGETERGTLLYPDDPQRRLEILWSDPGAKRAPKRVILRGERSRWMLPKDVSLGISLSELVQKNGRPFKLSGFGWDYAGAVISWNGGALDSLLRGVHVYLDPRIEDRAGRAYRRLLGDHEFDSENPDMRAIDPRIYQIFVDFETESQAASRRGAGATTLGGR